MKFRTHSRLAYLKRARHRGGHGIHSPFLFRLITSVVEDKRRIPEYRLFKRLKNRALDLLGEITDPSLAEAYELFSLAPGNPKQFYKKVELPLRYSTVVFRLIRDFKPAAILNYGPTLGINPAVMATANKESQVCLVVSDQLSELFCTELFKDFPNPNIRFSSDDAMKQINPGFIVINYPFNPDLSGEIVHRHLTRNGDDDVLIIRGIHESQEMEDLWLELIANVNVRVSLDLFEIGIALFRKGLQKENFVLKY